MKFIVACKILLIGIRTRYYDILNKRNFLSTCPQSEALMKKTLKCSWKLTFWLDTASSMWIFVDWKTSHTFLMYRTVYTMKHCEPLCWVAIIYHERWSSEAEQESAKAIALKNNGHYSLKMFLVWKNSVFSKVLNFSATVRNFTRNLTFSEILLLLKFWVDFLQQANWYQLLSFPSLKVL